MEGAGRVEKEDRTTAVQPINNITNNTSVVAPSQSLGTDTLESQNRFAGLEVEGKPGPCSRAPTTTPVL
ncbi:BQ5605_C009g05599 [Microbotryum silenes-dioicae]|uniref:BQ5605_C009g05599 protein n=1 Tax=Microbotryum silenes-dioicae TaxID=796604 RepID=A0A2X0PFP1_9BASI|nr:BQ5605_C009g05599 [Microbotryum silenes-dioicae]